jgi:hypothetical protein
MYCLCTRCIIVNSVQVRSEFGKFAYTAICMRKCTLWSDNTCVFTRFHCVKNANTQLIWSSDNGMNSHLGHLAFQNVAYECTRWSLLLKCVLHSKDDPPQIELCPVHIQSIRTLVRRNWLIARALLWNVAILYIIHDYVYSASLQMKW